MKQTLFPEIPPTEQIARYKHIHALLAGYREGTVSMEQVLVIPKDEVRQVREWVRETSFRSWERDVPEYGDEDEL